MAECDVGEEIKLYEKEGYKMNVYIIYKFSEYNSIFKHIEKFINENPNDKIFYFKPENKKEHQDWELTAKKKIADADVILYIRLNASKELAEETFKNVSYELEEAQEHHKNIIVVEIPLETKPNTNEIIIANKGVPAIIYEKDFLEHNCIKYKVIDSLDMKAIKAEIFDMNKELFSVSNMKPDSFSWLLLEEYKIMLDTSERMMDRRQGTNSFYITLCTAMLTVIVGFVATKANTFAWSAVTFVISGMMLFICDNWKKTLEAYGLSNQAKYEVLNKIEEKLPASIFKSEWKYGKSIKYSSYSKRESKVPQTFFCLFFLIMAAMLIVFFLTSKNYIPQNLFN